MTEFEKAIKIVEQINKLDMDQTPLFTWDEMEAVKKEKDKEANVACSFGVALGILVTVFIYEIFIRK